MKSRITRFASIGMILSLVLAGSSATLAQYVVSPSLHIHKGAISYFPAFNEVLAKITASCTGGTGTVTVTITQSAAQSNANMAATGSGASSVKCDGHARTIAVSVSANYANIGEAAATAMLTVGASTVATAMRTIELRFPVIEGMEEEQGGND